MESYDIVALPGDGIGQEVVQAARSVLDVVSRKHGFRLNWREYDWGCERFLSTGSMMPSDALERIADCNAIFLGAVGRPDVPDHISLWGMLIPIRRELDLFVNERPVKTFDGLRVPVNPTKSDIDLLFIRENSEGEYSEMGGRFRSGFEGELAIQESVFTRFGIKRIAEYAGDMAMRRGSHVTSATKSNGIIHTMPFWDEIVAVTLDNMNVAYESVHVDALAANMILAPEKYDVVLASNLFGDILSEIGAAITGGIGIAPSANVDPSGKNPSLFEPIHGSAPDIAGKGIANPIGQLWSGVMMLRNLGQVAAADDLFRAVENSLSEPETRTIDVNGTANTAAVVRALVQDLETD